MNIKLLETGASLVSPYLGFGFLCKTVMYFQPNFDFS